MQTYEVEVKSLLGSEESAEVLRARMRHLDPESKVISRNKQLNHYFMGGDMVRLAAAVTRYVSSEALTKIKDIALRGKEFSVRTRDKDGEVFLVVKASVGEDSSSNGVARIEVE